MPKPKKSLEQQTDEMIAVFLAGILIIVACAAAVLWLAHQ